MDSNVLKRKSLNNQTPQVDRFVHSRSVVAEKCVQKTLNFSDKPEEIVWKKEASDRQQYLSDIGNAIGRRSQIKCPRVEDQRYHPSAWPCIPRRKSYLSSADSVLDLPHYNLASLPELLDWGKNDIIVAALGSKYYKWSWSTQNLINKGQTTEPVFTVKFDPSGELLALGTLGKAVEVHNTELNKCIAKAYCCCKKTCSVTAVDWSPTGNSFATGCTQGRLIALTKEANVIRQRRISDMTIAIIRISPDARYIATTMISSNKVFVFCWLSLAAYATVDSDEWFMKTLAWHPWRSALLGIGALTTSNYTGVSLWDAPTAKLRSSTISPSPCNIDYMLFSHRTGEMVLSLWSEEKSPTGNPTKGSRIVVMSDMDTVVDEWGEGSNYLDRVRMMVFNGDDTKLATASLGEDLIIWNFLPEDERTSYMVRNKDRFTTLPVLLDKSLYGFSMR